MDFTFFSKAAKFKKQTTIFCDLFFYHHSSIDNNNNNNSFKLEGKRNYTQLKQQQREQKFKKGEEKRYSTKKKKKEKEKIQNKKNKQKKTKTISVLKPSIGEVTLPSKLQKKCLVQRDIKYLGSVFSNRS